MGLGFWLLEKGIQFYKMPLNSVVDYLIAKKILAQPIENQEPYSIELNKKQPHITRQDRLPEMVTQYPKLPPEIAGIAQSAKSKLSRVQELVKEIKEKEAEFKKTLQAQMQERNQLTIEANELAQTLGPAVQAIDPHLDELVAYFDNMFIIAQQEMVQKTTQTMAPGAQLELLKGLLLQADQELGTKVVAKFEEAIKKFEVTTTNITKTVRMWPISKEKMTSSIKILIAQIEFDIKSSIHDIYELISSGLSDLISLETDLHDQMPVSSNVTPMIQPETSPMAAAASVKEKYPWRNARTIK